MILRYKGTWVKIDKRKWKEQAFKDKLKCIKEYFQNEAEYISKRFRDYWIGYVNIHKKDILCCESPMHEELCSISIICGRFGRGQYFHNIDKDMVEQLINDWEFSDKKKFHLNLCCGAYQQYTFSKRQKNMLIEQLKPLLDMKWYEDR